MVRHLKVIDKEYGGVHYAITYGLSVKAELL